MSLDDLIDSNMWQVARNKTNLRMKPTVNMYLYRYSAVQSNPWPSSVIQNGGFHEEKSTKWIQMASETQTMLRYVRIRLNHAVKSGVLYRYSLLHDYNTAHDSNNWRVNSNPSGNGQWMHCVFQRSKGSNRRQSCQQINRVNATS